ncbi:MAG: penicillin-binding protein activator [Pseudomonadota bacterium]
MESPTRRRSRSNSLHIALLCAFFCLLVSGCAANLKNPFGKSGLHSENQGANGPTNTPQLKRNTTVKVALLLPLGSAKKRTANIAKSLKQAGELALFDFDKPNIAIITRDTKGTPEGAKKAAEAAIKAGASLIIGPLFATSVRAAAPITRQANIPMIAFSSDRSVAGDGVYLLSFLAGRDIPRIISYAVSKGKRKFAALIPKTAYGNIVEASFKKVTRDLGAEAVAIERYPLDANAMLDPIKRIAELTKDEFNPIDAILIPAGPATLPSLSPLIPYFEIDTQKVQLIGTGQWDYANIGREKPLFGGWFPAPEPGGWRDFTQRYVKTYGKSPHRIASLSYDAVSLAVSLSSNERNDRFTKSQLTRPSGFAGIDGLFRLLPDGTSERGLAVLEVQKFGFKTLDNAPNAFNRAEF